MDSGQRTTSLVNAYVFQISAAFAALGRDLPWGDAEKLASFLLRSMGSESRDYHRPEHPLDVSKNLSPVAKLAALFHDIVYVQVDASWEDSLADVFFPFVPSDRFQLDVPSSLAGFPLKSDDADTLNWLQKIVSIFGFHQESMLGPSRGLNEFLSAVVFYKKMRGYLTDSELLRGVACIEATIPFRKTDDAGNSPAERLRTRIQNFVQDENELNLIILDCRNLIENDLISFSAETVKRFLSSSWNVMIENHPALRNHYYSLKEYRFAIAQNINFFSSLQPKQLFWKKSGVADLPYELLVRRTECNLGLALEYMSAIDLAVTVVSALAELTGGDAPFELFFGPTKKSREHTPVNMESLIQFQKNEIDSAGLSEQEVIVFKSLAEGRDSRSRFDLKTSRLSAYLYLRYCHRDFSAFKKAVIAYHGGELRADDFLSRFDQDDIEFIISLLEQTAHVRRDRLLQWKREFYASARKIGRN